MWYPRIQVRKEFFFPVVELQIEGFVYIRCQAIPAPSAVHSDPGTQEDSHSLGGHKHINCLNKVSPRPLEPTEPPAAIQAPGTHSASVHRAGRPACTPCRWEEGGYMAQIHATLQSISKALVAYYQEYMNEASRNNRPKTLSSGVTNPC